MDVNKIYNMDCVEGMKLMPKECVDLTVTSPPYDDLREYNGYNFNFEETANQLYRITKEGGVVVWIVNDATINGSETGTSFRQALYFKKIGFNLHDTMIWQKFSPFQSKNRYIPSFEYMFVFSKGKPKTSNIIKDRKNIRGGEKNHGTERQKDGTTRISSSTKKQRYVFEYGSRLNIWDMAGCMSNIERTGHPAQFPVALAADHIITWSNQNDVVLDCFMGSGTTAIAAYQTGRKFIGFEISKEYYDLASERIEAEMAQLKLF